MGYRAVALSQVGGAGGEHIGHELPRKLGFAYLNEAIVAQVAEGSGVERHRVCRRGPSDGSPSLPECPRRLHRPSLDYVRADSALYLFDETDRFLGLIRDTVRRDAADSGNVVLVSARGLLRLRGSS